MKCHAATPSAQLSCRGQSAKSALVTGMSGPTGPADASTVAQTSFSLGPVAMLDLRVDLVLDDDGDEADLDEGARQLRRELLQLDVDDVQLVAEGSPPSGARAVDPGLVASLAVAAGQGVIGAVVRAVTEWVGRRTSRVVKLTIEGDSIELANVSNDDQHMLVAAFLARHGPVA